MAQSTSTPSSSSPSSHGRALQDTTNAQSSQITEIRSEVLSEELNEDKQAVAEAEEDSESPPGSTGSSAKSDAVVSSPIGSTGSVTSPPEPSPLELPSSCKVFPGQPNPPSEKAGNSTGQDAVSLSPEIPAEHTTPLTEPNPSKPPPFPNDIPDLTLPKSTAKSAAEDAADSAPTILTKNTAVLSDPSSVEIPSSSKVIPHELLPSPATNTLTQKSSLDQSSSPSDTLADFASLTLQNTENSSSQQFSNDSIISSDADDELSDSPTSNPMSETCRLEYFDNLVDHTHTQDIIEDARKQERRWPTKKPVDPNDDKSSDDNQPTVSCELSSSRVKLYIFLHVSGKLIDITTPPSLGSLPVARSWTSKQLRVALAEHYASRNRINQFARDEQRNPYQNVDLNRAWQRLYYSTTVFYLTDRPLSDREKEVTKQEKRVRICESLSRFSWKRQLVPCSFDRKWAGGKKFGICFEGDYDMHSGWSREPGSWWNVRKRLFVLPARLLFVDAVEAEVRDISTKTELGWENSETYQPLRSRKRLHPESKFLLEDFVELRAFGRETKGLLELEENESLTKEIPGLQGTPGEELPSLPKFQKLRRVHRDKFISEKWRQRRRVQHTGKWTDLTVIDIWRQRRRAQEKKAGRWTDGTVRMNRMWEEYHWVCDDAGIMSVIQQPFRSSDIFAERWFDERWAWLV